MKTIDIHKDYVLYNMMTLLKSQLHTICSYMQERTPYGEEYIAAFEQYKKVNTEIDKLESLLSECVDKRG